MGNKDLVPPGNSQPQSVSGRSQEAPSPITSIIAPREATPEMLDRAVSFALCVSLSADYGWSQYMADLWRQMTAQLPGAYDHG